MPSKPPVFGRKSPSQRRGGSVAIRDSSAAYRRRRLAILARDPLCQYCRAIGRITAATILDHLRALSLGGDDSDANLIPCCRACNDAKAADEMRYLARNYAPRDILHDPAMAEWFRKARA